MHNIKNYKLWLWKHKMGGGEIKRLSFLNTIKSSYQLKIACYNYKPHGKHEAKTYSRFTTDKKYEIKA